jgi:recombination protein RecA
MNELKTLDEKMKLLKEVQQKVNKRYGERALMTGKEAIALGALDNVVVSTPSLELNKALYCGGLSGIVELYGPPASGKTSLAIETLAKAQKNDPNLLALWVETEHSITEDILAQHGVDISRISIADQANVDNAESILDIAYAVMANGIVGMVIVNSVAGFLPKQEFESDLDKQNVAATARMMSKLFRKITGPAGKNKINVIFINQLRDKVGVMFGDPSTTTGGRALAFYADQRIRMSSLKLQDKDPIRADEGVKIHCIVQKNRRAGKHNPNTECTYYALFDKGIDSTVSIPQLLSENGIFEVSGRWWYYPSKTNVQTLAGVECKFGSKQELQAQLMNNEAFKEAVLKLIDVNEVSVDEKEKIIEEEQANEAFMIEADGYEPVDESNDNNDVE